MIFSVMLKAYTILILLRYCATIIIPKQYQTVISDLAYRGTRSMNVLSHVRHLLDRLSGDRFNYQLSRAIDEATIRAESSDATERAYAEWALGLLTRCIPRRDGRS